MAILSDTFCSETFKDSVVSPWLLMHPGTRRTSDAVPWPQICWGARSCVMMHLLQALSIGMSFETRFERSRARSQATSGLTQHSTLVRALALPDICGSIEYPVETSGGAAAIPEMVRRLGKDARGVRR